MRPHGFSHYKALVLIAFLCIPGCTLTVGIGEGPSTVTAASGLGNPSPFPDRTLPPQNAQTPASAVPPSPTPAPGIPAKMVSAGRRHTCIVDEADAVECWGDNKDMQLGDGTIAPKNRPVKVAGLEGKIVEVAAGFDHTCALAAGGSVYCWGNNAYGQLGDGTQISRPAPVKVKSADSEGGVFAAAAHISAGGHHSCATDGKSVYCWGIIDYRIAEGVDAVYPAVIPVAVDSNGIPDEETIVSLGSGYTHDCVLTDAGNVYCWGWNGVEQLGRGVQVYSSNVPLKVAGLDRPARFLTVGGYHACVIHDDKTVSCWGFNQFGQVTGIPSADSAVPRKMDGLFNAVSIGAGTYHTCAVVEGGRAKCWGDNRWRALGGTVLDPENRLVDVVDASASLRSIDGGGYHTCALTESGVVACWGNNRYGQLGIGTFSSQPIPTTVPGAVTPGQTPSRTAPPSNRVTSIAAGHSHACAVVESGEVWCWGKNEHGSLGDGTWADSNRPVKVASLAGEIQAVVAGWEHTCALTGAGGVKCWGYNKNGELGDGTNADSSVPVDVHGLANGVVSIGAGDDHTCAVLDDGGVECWGYNKYGELGNGTEIDSNVPVKVYGLNVGVIAVAGGWDHSCALTVLGGVVCWGNNEYGQLGNGSAVESRSTPVIVQGLTQGVSAISAGGGHACALLQDASVVCWGNNQYGQLGDGTGENRKTPVAVISLPIRVGQIAAGRNHTCAVGNLGELFCWGWNYYGQLGNGFRTSSTKPVEADEFMYGALGAALGWGFTCAVTDPGGIQCWGLNESGQLGDGTNANGYLPVDVIGLTG
jgi:alpha-tubulin suppressor-like RCC1 family protein